MDGFRPPAGHTGFLAKQLFAGDGSEHSFGEIIGGAIAYLEPGGGGPTQMHTHPHNHLFIVVSDRALWKPRPGRKPSERMNRCWSSGPVPHSVWNGTDSTTVMLGISVHPASYSERMPRAESAGQAESAKPAGPTDCTEPMKSTEDM
ncbi:MAG: hypothetical protein ACLTZY_04670 [Alistipes indistinctus]